MVCEKCGAIKCELGQEPTPALFIEHLLTIFDEVGRVMRPDATLWVNLGDSYSGGGKGPTGKNGIGDQEQRQGFTGISAKSTLRNDGRAHTGPYAGEKMREPVLGGGNRVEGIPAKNLLLIPERFAIGMQERGWIVRSQIVWSKLSAMPESTRDRPTSAWEPIFMFSKQPRYYFDQDAVRTPAKSEWAVRTPSGWDTALGGHGAFHREGRETSQVTGETRSGGANIRNVWTLGPSPFKDAHFATFPPEIPRRCILAGTSEKGACPACGAPWVRVVERNGASKWAADDDIRDFNNNGRTANPQSSKSLHRQQGGVYSTAQTTGWAPSCSCPPAEPRPCVVLDPFLGSGTTALVADRLGRDAIGIELNPTYAQMARRRIENDAPMVSEPVEVQTAEDQLGLFGEVAG